MRVILLCIMPKTFTCIKCTYTTTKSSDFTRHKKSQRHIKIHADESSNQLGELSSTSPCNCPYCGQSISAKKNLSRHFKACKNFSSKNIIEELNEVKDKNKHLEHQLQLERAKYQRLLKKSQECDNISDIAKDVKLLLNKLP